MFLASVIVGRYAEGTKEMSRPPDLGPGGFELYDSTVDNEENPKCFVVYDNEQCYPTYLIRYRDLKWNDNQSTT